MGAIGAVCNGRPHSGSRARVVPPGRTGQDRTRPPAAAVPAADTRVSLRGPGRGAAVLPVFPKHHNTAVQHRRSSTSTPPKTILLIGARRVGSCGGRRGPRSARRSTQAERGGAWEPGPRPSAPGRGGRAGPRAQRAGAWLRGGRLPSCGWSASRAEAQPRCPALAERSSRARSRSRSRSPDPSSPPPALRSPAAPASRSLPLSPLTFPSPCGPHRAPAAGGHCRPPAARSAGR